MSATTAAPVVVFLGPSLPLAEARAVLSDADYRPPVAMGDVFAALREAALPRAIVIIDGYFERTPAVWHKEILLALERGVPVYGAASMGALRAAELWPFGMIGVGSVFEQFRDGALTDDDEVAVAHGLADEGYRPASDAMVSLRAGLARAESEGRISAQSRAALVALAKGRFYPERCWGALFADAAERGAVPAGELAALREMVRARGAAALCAKRADARAVLERLARDLSGAALGGGERPVRVEPSSQMLALLGERAARGNPLFDQLAMRHRGAAASLGRYVRALAPAREELVRDALGLYLLAREAAATGAAPSFFAALERVAPRGVAACDPGAVDAAVRALEDAVHAHRRPYIELFLAAAAARRGALPAIDAALEQAWAHARARGVEYLLPEDADATLEELVAWYERRPGVPVRGSAEAHAEACCVELDDFVSQLVAFYLAEAR